MFGLNRLLVEPGVIIVRGPRQYGKSTWPDLELRDTIREFGRGTTYCLNGDEILSAEAFHDQLVELDTAFPAMQQRASRQDKAAILWALSLQNAPFRTLTRD